LQLSPSERSQIGVIGEAQEPRRLLGRVQIGQPYDAINMLQQGGQGIGAQHGDDGAPILLGQRYCPHFTLITADDTWARLDTRQLSGSSTIAPRARRSANASGFRKFTPRTSDLITSTLSRFARQRSALLNDTRVRFAPVKSASVRSAPRKSESGRSASRKRAPVRIEPENSP
jgi:hypothetical protein